MRQVFLCASLTLLLIGGGCGGGGGGDDPPGGSTGNNPPAPSAPANKADSARFLSQASFGPTAAEIDRLAGMTYEAWLNEQFAAAPSLHYPSYLNYYGGDPANRTARLEVWMEHALRGQDQLRQRVAFALSQIMVVSETGGGLNGRNDGLAWYYDILVSNAFGNFRTLLEQVTLAPVMGRYLSMLGNEKPNPATGLRADENFAREVMQLFTLGLGQLNLNGTPKLDGTGQQRATYTQAEIEGLARVFTGWWFAGAARFGGGPQNWTAPMAPFEAFHDTDAKTIVGGVAVPAGGSAAQDLQLALDTLFNHPNVGPFIGKQLIQKLVRSNPSPAYVGRVAAVFNDNGLGQRGDLKAVIRAILLDREARVAGSQTHFGKPREPLLVLTHLWRLGNAVPGATGRYTYTGGSGDFGQSPLGAPSVFNFFSPLYAPPGAIGDAGLVSPEFQLANESSVAVAFNRLNTAIFRDYAGNANSPANALRIDLAPWMGIAADPAALTEVLNLQLASGQLTNDYKNALSTYLAGVAATDGGRARVQSALYLVMTSPQYLVQK